MENLKKLQSEISNTILLKIYRTKKPTNEFWFDGLGKLQTYKFILELDNGKKYEFSSDFVGEWNANEQLVELETKYKNEFNNKHIIDVIVDPEFGSVFFRLENEMVLYHDNDFGSELCFEKYNALFNEDGKLI